MQYHSPWPAVRRLVDDAGEVVATIADPDRIRVLLGEVADRRPPTVGRPLLAAFIRRFNEECVARWGEECDVVSAVRRRREEGPIERRRDFPRPTGSSTRSIAHSGEMIDGKHSLCK